MLLGIDLPQGPMAGRVLNFESPLYGFGILGSGCTGPLAHKKTPTLLGPP